MERAIRTTQVNQFGVISSVDLSSNQTAMRKLLILGVLALIISSFFGCGGSGRGQLVGVQGREEWYMDDPFGMLNIPMGSYNMGPADQDVPYAVTAQAKTVSVQSFYMDETEITNVNYREYLYWLDRVFGVNNKQVLSKFLLK